MKNNPLQQLIQLSESSFFGDVPNG